MSNSFPSTLPIWAIVYRQEIQSTLGTPFPKDQLQIVWEYLFAKKDWQSSLAPFQKIAFDYCCKSTMNVFITGPAGCGKTFLLDSIVKYNQSKHKRVVVTATTGTAAVMISGQTIHSFAKLHVLATDPQFEHYDYAQIWRNVDILIIDEISMLRPTDFQVLCRLWQYLSDSYQIKFQLIVLGDFYQLPPVEKDLSISSSSSSSKRFETHYCFETHEWSKWIERSVYLYDVFRQTDQIFVRILNRIRTGQFTAFDIEQLQQRWIGHQLYHNARPIQQHKDEYTWIFARNVDADHHNANILNRIEGTTHVYKAVFGIAMANNKRGKSGEPLYNRYHSPQDMSCGDRYFKNDSIRKAFSARDELHLKVGIRVMLTVNTQTENGLVNGACGTIVKFDVHPNYVNYKDFVLPVVKFDNGVTSFVFLQEWKQIVERTVHQDVRVYAFITQLPLQYAYATTVHKSQGRTLSNLIVSTQRLFVAAQGYVALSRAKSLEDLHLLEPIHARIFQTDKRVQAFYNGICLY